MGFSKKILTSTHNNLVFFLCLFFFCLDTKEKIKPADKELQNYGSLRYRE